MAALLLLALFLAARVHVTQSVRANLTKPEIEVWMDSVMLSHTLHWKVESPEPQQAFTVSWRILYEKEWEAVPGCIDINRTTCNLSRVLDHAAMTYELRVTATNGASKEIEFCPEFDTRLQAPRFKAFRRQNIVFLHPQLPTNLGTGEPILHQLMTLEYQIKVWPEGNPEAENITHEPLMNTQLHTKVFNGMQTYCVAMRLHEEYYAMLNTTSSRSPWSEKVCLKPSKMEVGGGIPLLICILSLVGLLLTSLGAYAVRRTCKLRKKMKSRKDIFVKRLDSVITTNVVDNFDLSSLHNHEQTDKLESVGMALDMIKTRNRSEKGYFRTELDSAKTDEHCAFHRLRSESCGYFSASSCNATTTEGSVVGDVFEAYDGSDYIPADILFLTGGEGAADNSRYVPEYLLTREPNNQSESDATLTRDRLLKSDDKENNNGSDLSLNLTRRSEYNEAYPGLNPTYSPQLCDGDRDPSFVYQV